MTDSSKSIDNLQCQLSYKQISLEIEIKSDTDKSKRQKELLEALELIDLVARKIKEVKAK